MSVTCFCLVHRGVLPFLDLPQEVEGQPIPEEEARTTPPRLYDVQINSGWFWLTKFLINYVQILTLINRLITNTATHAAPVCGKMVSTSTRLPTPEEWKAELAWLSDLLRTVYPYSGRLPTTDRETPPAEDRRPNH